MKNSSKVGKIFVNINIQPKSIPNILKKNKSNSIKVIFEEISGKVKKSQPSCKKKIRKMLKKHQKILKNFFFKSEENFGEILR